MADTLRAEALLAYSMDFESLLREHQSMVFSLAYRFLQDRASAEEVAQDVFVALHGRLRCLQSPEHVKFWLWRTTTHRCIDYARKHRRQRREVPLEGLPEPAATATVHDPLLLGRLQQLVASLPEKARAIVILRYQEDMEHAEIAEALSMPENSVRSGLHRALALLREKMERTMGELR